MVNPVYKRIERYICGLPPQIQGMVTSSKPTTIASSVRMVHNLADLVKRSSIGKGNSSGHKGSEHKRKCEDDFGRSQGHQQARRTEGGNTLQVAPPAKKSYIGTKPYCTRCNTHHYGQCTIVCGNCRRIGHTTRDCRNPNPDGNQGAPRGCFECGADGHVKRDCPRLRNQNNNRPNNNARANNNANPHPPNNNNRGNNDVARGRAFGLRAGEAHEDPNIATGMFDLLYVS
uniref:uncharacterized protein LOC122609275 n=1 Tax=Erigeron canadensis TaxID=72917 RepID=UPI001CB88CBF|nr:uncharacterized protein LOC122609275 [Erigeron canadensis]